MCTASMPPRLAALSLEPGHATPRHIETCTEDDDHNVVTDAWAIWDPMLQAHVFDSDMGNPICNDCAAPVANERIDVINAVAIAQLRTQMTAEITRLEAQAARPVTEVGAWRQEVCKTCGETGVLIDIYATFDPVLNTGEVMTTFQQGHNMCNGCDGETRPRQRPLSNHEILVLKGEIEERIAHLRAELGAVDAWVAAHGAAYGVDTAKPA